jgi:hypothetical protein
MKTSDLPDMFYVGDVLFKEVNDPQPLDWRLYELEDPRKYICLLFTTEMQIFMDKDGVSDWNLIGQAHHMEQIKEILKENL